MSRCVWGKARSHSYPAKTEVALRSRECPVLHPRLCRRKPHYRCPQSHRARQRQEYIPLSSRKIQSYLSTQDTVSAIAEAHSRLRRRPKPSRTMYLLEMYLALFFETRRSPYWLNRASASSTHPRNLPIIRGPISTRPPAIVWPTTARCFMHSRWRGSTSIRSSR